MKKLALLFCTVTTVIFASCSGNDGIFLHEIPTATIKTYPVDIQVANDEFKVEKQQVETSKEYIDPLKVWKEFNNLQIVAYQKETGKVSLDTIMSPATVLNTIQSKGDLSFTLSLPEGNYRLVFFSTMVNRASDPTISTEDRIRYDFRIRAASYNADAYTGIEAGQYMDALSNYSNFFAKTEISVKDTTNQTTDVILKPIWSNVSLVINDLRDAIFPEACDYIEIVSENSYGGFFAKNGYAAYPLYYIYTSATKQRLRGQLIRRSDIAQKTATLNYTFSEKEDNAIAFKVRYLTKNESGYYIPVDSSSINLPNVFENGYNYNISGSLKDYSANGATKISLGAVFKEKLTLDY